MFKVVLLLTGRRRPSNEIPRGGWRNVCAFPLPQGVVSLPLFLLPSQTRIARAPGKPQRNSTGVQGPLSTSSGPAGLFSSCAVVQTAPRSPNGSRSFGSSEGSRGQQVCLVPHPHFLLLARLVNYYLSSGQLCCPICSF